MILSSNDAVSATRVDKELLHAVKLVADRRRSYLKTQAIPRGRN